MPEGLTNIEFKLFRKYIEEKCGVDIPEEKSYLIETRLSKLLFDSGLTSFEELYYEIRNNNDYHISEKIIDAITTNETLWFRDKTPWTIIEDILMPEYIKLIRSGKKQKIRIWSAAASTGQEAYSVAMLIDSWLEKHKIKDVGLCDFEILATDISSTVLDIAKKGRYDAISVMRGLDTYYKEKYFSKNGIAWEIDDKIKSSVKFDKFNLQGSFMFIGKFDLILCRYVLIYFSNALRDDIFIKLKSSMNINAVLLLGASELYAHSSEYFDMLHYSNGAYYKERVNINENAYGR